MSSCSSDSFLRAQWVTLASADLGRDKIITASLCKSNNSRLARLVPLAVAAGPTQKSWAHSLPGLLAAVDLTSVHQTSVHRGLGIVFTASVTSSDPLQSHVYVRIE